MLSGNVSFDDIALENYNKTLHLVNLYQEIWVICCMYYTKSGRSASWINGNTVILHMGILNGENDK